MYHIIDNGKDNACIHCGKINSSASITLIITRARERGGGGGGGGVVQYNPRFLVETLSESDNYILNIKDNKFSGF